MKHDYDQTSLNYIYKKTNHTDFNLYSPGQISYPPLSANPRNHHQNNHCNDEKDSHGETPNPSNGPHAIWLP